MTKKSKRVALLPARFHGRADDKEPETRARGSRSTHGLDRDGGIRGRRHLRSEGSRCSTRLRRSPEGRHTPRSRPCGVLGGGSLGALPRRSAGLFERAAREALRPLSSSAGPRHEHPGRAGAVPDDGRVRGVREGIIQERVRAGLARARAAGTRLGRPTVGESLEARIRELKAEGLGIRKIASTLGTGVSVVQRVTKAA